MIKSTILFCVLAVGVSVQAEEVSSKKAVEQAVAMYNSLSNRDEALAVMRSVASPADIAYLDLMRTKISSTTLPRARAEGNALYVQGLDKPIYLVDASKGIFSYGDRKFILDLSKEIRVNMQILEENIRPQQFSWMNWVLPQAHADFDFMSLLMGGGIVGLGALAFTSTDPTTKMVSGIGAGALAVGALWKYSSDKKKAEQKRENWRQKWAAGYQGPIPAPYAYQLPPVYQAPAVPFSQTAAAPVTIQTVTPGAGSFQ